MENLTYNDLPSAVTLLYNEVVGIKQMLLDKSNSPTIETEQWFNLNQLCEYLPDKPAKATVYSWVHNGLIPHHKGAKRLRFLKSEIDLFLQQGKQKTNAEISADADNYIKSKNKK